MELELCMVLPTFAAQECVMQHMLRYFLREINKRAATKKVKDQRDV